MFYKVNINKYNLDLSLPKLMAEYSRVYHLAKNRTKTFQDHKDNYYWKRLNDLEILIELKKNQENK